MSFEDGLINGSRGIVHSVDSDPDGNVEVVNDTFPHLPEPVPISRTSCHSYRLSHGAIIELYQFPLTLSWAVTAHKSQGQTLSRVAVNIGEEAFAHGAFYVALSRVRKLSDLLLFGLPEWPHQGLSFHVNPFIHAEAAHLGSQEHVSQPLPAE